MVSSTLLRNGKGPEFYGQLPVDSGTNDWQEIGSPPMDGGGAWWDVQYVFEYDVDGGIFTMRYNGDEGGGASDELRR